MILSDRLIQQLTEEAFAKGDVVYISPENWDLMFSGNRGLKRYPSDDYMNKLKPFYVNKTLGKIVDVFDNGTVDVQFNDKVFGLKNQFVTKLESKGEVKEESINESSHYQEIVRVTTPEQFKTVYDFWNKKFDNKGKWSENTYQRDIEALKNEKEAFLYLIKLEEILNPFAVYVSYYEDLKHISYEQFIKKYKVLSGKVKHFDWTIEEAEENFNVGDRIIVTNPDGADGNSRTINKKGTVVIKKYSEETPWPGVKFDVNVGGYNIMKSLFDKEKAVDTYSNKGWWCPPSHIKKIYKKSSKVKRFDWTIEEAIIDDKYEAVVKVTNKNEFRDVYETWNKKFDNKGRWSENLFESVLNNMKKEHYLYLIKLSKTSIKTGDFAVYQTSVPNTSGILKFITYNQFKNKYGKGSGKVKFFDWTIEEADESQDLIKWRKGS